MRISKKSSTFVALFIAKSGAKLQQKFQIRKSKVKNSNIFIVLALVLSSQWSVVAAEPSTTKANHYIGAYAEVDYWHLFPKSPGFASSVGGTYELQYGKFGRPTFLLCNIGVGIKGGGTKSYGDGMLQIPILLGLQYKKFYFLTGCKLDVPFGILGSKYDIILNPTFEIGGRLGNVPTETGYDVPKRTIEYRLAAFGGYGYGMGGTADVAPTRDNMFVGLKFTVLFQMRDKKISVVNDDSYIKSKPTTKKRGSNNIDSDAYVGSGSRFSGGVVKYEE